MLKKIATLVAGLALPALLLAGGPAAAEIGAHSFKFAAQNQKGHPQVMGMEKFAELLEKKSGGKMTAKLFPGGTLGGDLQTLSALQGGIIEMTVLNAGLLAGLSKDFALVDLPFRFDTPEQADAVMDGAFGQALAGQLPDKGLIGLGYWELGFRQLTNKRRAVATADDIAGLKIRVVQTPVLIDLFNALGANAVPMPYPEVYTALETGTVDGQENPYANVLSAKFYEVQKHLTQTRHVYNPQILLIGKKTWDGLNEDERKVMREAADEARVFQRAASRAQDNDAKAQLAAKGLQVVELAPAEVEKLRAKAKPVIDKHAALADPAMVKLFDDELQKARR